VIAIGVAKAFSRGVLFGLGLALLSFIFYPILAFASD
jgi:VIT1/CCC1 family predicted Fe2+/Mn2+ transporter